MYRSCAAMLLLVLSALLLWSGIGTGQDSATLPYEGTWKITVPNQQLDVTFWLIRIDKSGKKATIVSGIDQYGKAKISDLKADGRQISFTLTLEKDRFQVTAQAPESRGSDVMVGSVVQGTTILPVWMQKTILEGLTPKSAIREMIGFKDLQEALNQKGAEPRLRGILLAITKHRNRPVHFLGLQALLAEHIRMNARAEEFKSTCAQYRRLAERHGTVLTISANLDLARNLIGHTPAADSALESAREAVKLLQPTHPMFLQFGANLTLANCLAAVGKTEELPALADRLEKLAEARIKEVKPGEETLSVTAEIASTLLGSSSLAVNERGLKLARRLVGDLKETATLGQRADACRLLYRGLLQCEKREEADLFEPRLQKIEDEIDRAYLQEINSQKLEKFAGRKSGSKRVVLVEYFTGAQYKSSFASSLAFDMARQTFLPKDVVFLQYHIAFPEPDSLVCPDSELRKAAYSNDLEGVPSVFVDGKLTSPLGGAKQRGLASYQVLREAITRALEVPAEANLALEVKRTGDTITASATVGDLRDPGPKLRLRFALVEERIRYQSVSEVRLHHQVVRAFLGGANGFRLDKKEQTQSASIILPQLRQSLSEYLDTQAKKLGVTSPVKPLELTKLKVIAFVQDEQSKRVLQAIERDVPAK